MSRLLLAEDGLQVDDFIQRGLDQGSEWIAMGPAAMARLEALGKPYRIPDDFCAAAKLGESVEDGHERLADFCDQADRALLEKNPDLERDGLRPFTFNTLDLVRIFDVCRVRILQLRHLSSAFPNSLLTLYRGPLSAPSRTLFSPKDTLWGQLAALEGWPHGRFEFLPALAGGTMEEKPGLRGFFADVLRRARCSCWIETLLQVFKTRDAAGLRGLVGSQTGALLVLGVKRDWVETLPALRARGWNILFGTPEALVGSLPENESALDSLSWLEKNGELMRAFDASGISFYPLVAGRLRWIWTNAPDQFRQAAQRVAALHRKYRFRSLLVAGSSSSIAHAVNQSARRLGIPVFSWQHGSVAYDRFTTQFNDYVDLMTSDEAFAYGEEPARAYSQASRAFAARVIPVGSADLDRVARVRRSASLGNGVKRIVFVVTNYAQYHWYYGFPPAWSDCRLYSDQALIASELKRWAEEGRIELTIKLHPSTQYLDPPWAEGYRGVAHTRVIKNQRSFVELCGDSDAVILDLPSTTLYQALAARLPTFVLTRHWRYPESGRQMLERRAVAADEVEPLVAGLKAFIVEGRYSCDLSDEQFLRQYGTFRGDGLSAQRAAEAIGRRLSASMRAAAASFPDVQAAGLKS